MLTQLKDAAMQAVHAFLHVMSTDICQAYICKDHNYTMHTHILQALST